MLFPTEKRANVAFLNADSSKLAIFRQFALVVCELHCNPPTLRGVVGFLGASWAVLGGFRVKRKEIILYNRHLVATLVFPPCLQSMAARAFTPF